jgi:hypothetical protein
VDWLLGDQRFLMAVVVVVAAVASAAALVPVVALAALVCWLSTSLVSRIGPAEMSEGFSLP